MASAPSAGNEAEWAMLPKNENDDPTVYTTLVSDGEAGSFRVYMTALSECGKSEKSSPATLLRQLFVGFSSFLVKNSITHDTPQGELTQWNMEGRLGDTTLLMQGFSSFAKGCTYDVVFWCEAPPQADESSERSEIFFERFGPRFAVLVEKTVPNR